MRASAGADEGAERAISGGDGACANCSPWAAVARRVTPSSRVGSQGFPASEGGVLVARERRARMTFATEALRKEG